MKSSMLILVSCLTAVLLTPVGTARAIEATGDTSVAESTEGLDALVVGRVAKVDGQRITVEEEGGVSVQVQITPDTHGATTLTIGEQVMVSVLPSGVASVITRGAAITDGEPLVGEPGAR